MRVIDADAFERAVMFSDDEDLQDVIYRLRDFPTIEPERKKGRWINHPEQKNIYGGVCVECSECGEKYIVQYIKDEKFCRNCGANMRGGGRE